MPILTILVIAFGLYCISPKLAGFAAWLLTLGFIVPLIAVTTGTLGWVVLNVVTGFNSFSSSAWLSCCAFVGLPAGVITAGYVLREGL